MSRIGLLVVDIQHDFIDGSLAVPGATDILPKVVELINTLPFDVIAVSQDFHPAEHISFASSHNSRPELFKPIALPHPNAARAARGDTISQMMWPEHCIQNTYGAEIHSDILEAIKSKEQQGTPVHTIQKGTNRGVDGYSAFADNAYLSFSQLARILFSAHVDTLVVVGLATDYCVLSSAIDAAKFHFNTIVVQDCTRGVAASSTKEAYEEMQAAEIHIVTNQEEAQAVLARRHT